MAAFRRLSASGDNGSAPASNAKTVTATRKRARHFSIADRYPAPRAVRPTLSRVPRPRCLATPCSVFILLSPLRHPNPSHPSAFHRALLVGLVPSLLNLPIGPTAKASPAMVGCGPEKGIGTRMGHALEGASSRCIAKCRNPRVPTHGIFCKGCVMDRFMLGLPARHSPIYPTPLQKSTCPAPTFHHCSSCHNGGCFSVICKGNPDLENV